MKNTNLTRAAASLLACGMVFGLTACSSSASSSEATAESAASSEAASESTVPDDATAESAADDYSYLADFSFSDAYDENGYLKGITALDYVTLPDTENFTLSDDATTVSDSDIDNYISNNILSNYKTTNEITNRAAENGDTVNIDFAGSIDGVAFDGGTGSDYDLTLGSGTFIDGFEDQIIGHNIGDTFDVTVTFPEGYGDSTDAEGNTITLSGKEAVFSVTLNAITQSVVPTLTDEWVESNFAASDDLHTADALRQYFDSALYANNLDNAAMDYLLTNSTFKEVPTQITSYYIRMFLNYHSQLATQYGMELDAYAQAKGYADANAMLADSDAYFEHLAKQDLVFQAIAEQLDITPTQEQIDSANSSYADTYGAQRSMLNALQLAVLDKVEESAVLS